MKNIHGYRSLIINSSTALAVGLFSLPVTAQIVLEEILVTAQKRVERLQDVSATVNVVTGESLREFAAFNFRDLEQQTAGLSLISPNARNNTIGLRGISVDPETGQSTAVDVYWNDAVVLPDIVFTQLYDLQRVEILRGPQGTLQGRTSPAGAINMITSRADASEANGYVQLSATDNAGLNTQVAYGTPLIENVLGIRAAAVYDTTAGPDSENLTTGFDDQEIEARSARISTVWNAHDSLSTELIWQYLDQEQDDPRAMTGVDSLGVRPTLAPDDNKALGPTNDFSEKNYNIATLLLDWEVLGHEISGVVYYEDSNKEAQTENDRANSVPLSDSGSEGTTFQTTDTEAEIWSYELRAASTDNDFWDYMAGVYYQDVNTDTAFLDNTVRLADADGLGLQTIGELPVYRNTFAVFTFNTFYLAQDLQLEAGLRWSNYDDFNRADINFSQITWLPPSLAPIEDIVLAGLEDAFPINAINDPNSSEDAFTGSVKLRWDWTDEISLYAAYNRGYRPGGISIIPTPAVASLPNGEDDLFYDEEESDAFELGVKSRLLDGRAELNGAVYYQAFDGYQGFVRGLQVLDENGVPQDLTGSIVYNGDAISWGAELEGRILFNENWSGGGALSYNNSEWDGATAPCNDREPGEVLGSCDIDGDELGGEPDWSLSLHSEYVIMLDTTQVYFRGLYKYTGERVNTDAAAGTMGVTDEFNDYFTLDVFTGWRSSDQRWDISLWARNVTDEDEVVFQQGPDQYDVFVSNGSYTQTATLQERTIGITARYSFE